MEARSLSKGPDPRQWAGAEAAALYVLWRWGDLAGVGAPRAVGRDVRVCWRAPC